MLQVNSVSSYTRMFSWSSGNVSTALQYVDFLDLAVFARMNARADELGLIRLNSAHLPCHTYSCKPSVYAGSNAWGKPFGLHSILYYVSWLKLS